MATIQRRIAPSSFGIAFAAPRASHGKTPGGSVKV